MKKILLSIVRKVMLASLLVVLATSCSKDEAIENESNFVWTITSEQVICNVNYEGVKYCLILTYNGKCWCGYVYYFFDTHHFIKLDFNYNEIEELKQYVENNFDKILTIEIK